MDERAELGRLASNERLGAGITRRRFLGALSAGTASIALSGTIGCEQRVPTRAAAAPRGAGRARAFRSRPDLRPPAIKVNTNAPEAAPGYVLLAGPGPDKLKPAGSVPRKGFETTVTLNTNEPYVAVKARDGSGRVLGASQAVKTVDRA